MMAPVRIKGTERKEARTNARSGGRATARHLGLTCVCLSGESESERKEREKRDFSNLRLEGQVAARRLDLSANGKSTVMREGTQAKRKRRNGGADTSLMRPGQRAFILEFNEK